MLQIILRISAPMLLHLLMSMLVVAVMGGRWDSAMLTAAAAMLTLPVALWMLKKDQDFRGKKVQGGGMPWWSYIPLAAAGAAISTGYSTLLNVFHIQEIFSNQVQEELFSSSFPVQLLGLGILAAVTEEIVFRGLMYQRLREYVGKNTAIFLGALIFALYHGNPIQVIYVFPLAVLILLSYEKWGTLAAPIAFHMGANICSIVINYFFAGAA